MRLLTIETESRLGTLWDQEKCNFARRKMLWAAARDEEMKIPLQEANEGLPVPEEQCVLLITVGLEEQCVLLL